MDVNYHYDEWIKASKRLSDRMSDGVRAKIQEHYALYSLDELCEGVLAGAKAVNDMQPGPDRDAFVCVLAVASLELDRRIRDNGELPKSWADALTRGASTVPWPQAVGVG